MSPTPVIQLHGIQKHYSSGQEISKALAGVDLCVQPGEFVAIVGPSGSGKSTLLNIIGCLDQPTLGTYALAGHDVSNLDGVSRSRARGAFLGFIFQGFNLLPGVTAVDNVELPLVYQGVTAEERRARALRALAQVGLSNRTHHTPTQLSGGQQQRVAIARALVTQPHVLLADEPTGNLDSHTSAEILGLLQHLHAQQGLTIVLVTHDAEVARAATRIVTVMDGLIVRDEPVHDRRVLAQEEQERTTGEARSSAGGVISLVGLVMMGLGLALKSLRRSKMRTALTTLGILIGIAAVVTTTALGAGAKERMEKEMLALGANMLVVSPGAAPAAGRVRGMMGQGSGLTSKDAAAILSEIPSVAAVAPTLSTNTQVVLGARNVNTRVTGTTPDYLKVRAWSVAQGSAFDEQDVESAERVCLIGQSVKRNLFPNGEETLGTTLRVGRTPCQVVGVLASKGQSGFGHDQDDLVVMPISTYRAHVARRSGDDVDSIMISVRDRESMPRAEATITVLLRQRHRIPADGEDDFSVRNLAEMMAALDSQRAAIAILLLAIASVSLLVGGIGVMNIMLVSVTERTREIGIRLAIGARPVDILAQFLLEAMVLAALGGVAGILLGVGASAVLGVVTTFSVQVQSGSALLAVAISCGVGIVFGFFPARRAAALDPMASLRHE